MSPDWKNFLGGYLNTCAEYNSDGDFLVFGDRHITWSDLNSRVNRLANALIDLGLRKNDKVSFMFRNCPEFFEINYAVQKAGGIPVPMNYRFTPREIEFQANHSDSVIFLLEDIWLDSVQKVKPGLTGIKHFIFAGEDCPDEMISYEGLMADYPSIDPEVEVKADDVCVICYTGGTTGRPKGVMLTYKSHVKMLEYMGRDIIFRLADLDLPETMVTKISETLPLSGTTHLIKLMKGPAGRFVLNAKITHLLLEGFMKHTTAKPFMIRFGPKGIIKIITPSLPYFHDASYNLIIMAPLTGQFIFHQPDMIHFDPAKVFEMIETEKTNMMVNVPTGWKMLVEDKNIDRYDLSSIAICCSGGGVNPVNLKKQILDNFSSALLMDLFGQTEMTPVTSIRLDSGSSSLKDRSVGRPIVNVRIVGESGEDVPQGQTGEIIYRSETIMKGYYKEEDKTAETMKDGWFYSGDLGYLDEEGEIRVVERKKECISTGGEKIFPQEVEEVLEEHPKVNKACVIGVPDDKWGNMVRAVIELKPGKKATKKEMIDWTREKIAGYKKPRDIKFIEKLPVTPVGKVQRNKVKEKYGSPESS